MAAKVIVAILAVVGLAVMLIFAYLHIRERQAAREHEKNMKREERDYDMVIESIEDDE